MSIVAFLFALLDLDFHMGDQTLSGRVTASHRTSSGVILNGGDRCASNPL